MRKLLIENLEVYEQHRETVEALIAEARALREEECEIAKIFSRLPETLATSELFNHFMRDVHMAHEVFQRRIEHLAAQGTADELQNLKNDKNELNGEMAAVREKLLTTQQEADRRLAKIRELEQNLKAAHSEKDSLTDQVKKLKRSEEKLKRELRLRLQSVREDDCEHWQQKGATLSFINTMNEWMHDDIKNAETYIDHVEQNIDWVNDHLINTQNGVNALCGIKQWLEDVTNAALNTRWLTTKDIKDLPNIVQGMLEKLENISNELDQALGALSRARNDDLSKARENLKTAEKKYEPIKKRTDKSSALERLVDYLKDIIWKDII